MHYDLEKFVALVEEGSFTKAGERLRLSQPALSVAIRKLEKSVGATLIVRDAAGLKLTDAGQEVYQTAKRMRQETVELQRRLEDLQHKQLVRPIRLGMIDSVGTLLFSQKIQIKGPLEVVIDNSTRLRQAVRHGQLEVAFITEPPAAIEEELSLTPLGKEKFVLVATPEAAKQIRRELRAHHKLAHFLTYNTESSTYALIQQALRKKNITAQVDFYSTNPELLRLLARSGRGAALLPKVLVRADIASDKLAEVPGVSFHRYISTVQRRDARMDAKQQAVVSLIEQLMRAS